MKRSVKMSRSLDQSQSGYGESKSPEVDRKRTETDTGDDGEQGLVMSSLHKQVMTLQSELKAQGELRVGLEEQLKRREEEWLRVSRQVRVTLNYHSRGGRIVVRGEALEGGVQLTG